MPPPAAPSDPAPWRERLWAAVEADVFPAPSADGLFNPYRDAVADLDGPDAAAIRRANLRAALDALPHRPPVLVVAEAPGPRGARFSGVPLVSERQLADAAFPLSGRPTAVKGPRGEASGGIYWRVVRPHWARVWTWNAVPLHPHRPGVPLSVRTPTAREVRAWHGHLGRVVAALAPERVVAVGRIAEGALRALGVAAVYVRHPSQGGARAFEAGMLEALGPPPG